MGVPIGDEEGVLTRGDRGLLCQDLLRLQVRLGEQWSCNEFFL